MPSPTPPDCGNVDRSRAALRRRRIDVDLSAQTATAYDGTSRVRRMNVSTGKATTPTPATPRGADWRIEFRQIDYVSRKYKSPMPYFQRYDWRNGIGFHQGRVVRGRGLSHGCIRMTQADARWLWCWAGIGTQVRVFGTTPSNRPRSP